MIENETREATSFGKKANEERRLFDEYIEISFEMPAILESLYETAVSKL